MAIFQIINESKTEDQISNIVSGHFQYWYKFSNLLMVEMLNCLVVAIGWLYWKTLNCFYNIKGLKIPTIYNNKVKYGVWTALACMVAIPCVSLAEVILSDFEIDQMLNWTVLGSTIVAATFFVSFRLIYFRNIFSSVKMSHKAVRR